MIALDTNIVLRACVEEAEGDEQTRRQADAARSLLMSGSPLFVPLTVSLEVEWVLRARYGYGPADVVKVLGGLAESEGVVLEHGPVIAAALDSYRRGMDFADALHLASSAACSEMASFDRDFAKKAGRLGLKPPVFDPGR